MSIVINAGVQAEHKLASIDAQFGIDSDILGIYVNRQGVMGRHFSKSATSTALYIVKYGREYFIYET